MLRKKSKRVIIFACFGLPLIVLLLLFEVEVNQSISTIFEVNPSQKWILARGNEGQIISSITDYNSVVSNNISIVQFERGESMNFHLVPSILSKPALSKGDTVAVMYSSRLQERLTKLKGELLVAKADLVAKSTGEKQPLIEEEKKKIEYTEAKIRQKRIYFERARELFNKSYISKEEFDACEWELKQAEIENEINKAQLQVHLSGSKNEDLQVLRTTIRSYLSEIELLEKRIKDFVLQSPIQGDIVRDFSTDTLLIVSNTSCLVMVAPIRYEEIHHLSEGAKIRIVLRSLSQELNGTIIAISKEAKTINGVQILYTRIALDSNKNRLVPGLMLSGKIILPKVTIIEYLASLFS
ncbi:MAG: hypothetical protein JXA06_12870 [Bacteroidetes bacterium]|nr:hypothetical protein [Bacteroidota bacterium]